MPSPAKQTGPLLGARVLAMIEKHGSPEEKRLAATGRDELISFLNHPDTLRFARWGLLDIGLENRLVLKLNLMAGRQMSPWGLIHEWAGRLPNLKDAAELVFRHKLRCHAGIKLSQTGIEYEIYPYETPDHLLQKSLFPHHSAPDDGLPAQPHCYGCSSTGELSAYAEIRNVDADDLENALGFPLSASGLKTVALFNSRLNPDNSWRTDKAGIEFLPFPSHLLNTTLTHFNLHFSYLLHRGGSRRYGVIGAHGMRQVLYTTLFTQHPNDHQTK